MSIKKNLQFRILYKKRKRKINFPNSCKYQIVANISVTIILNLPKSTIPFRSLERVFHLVQHGCDSNTNQMTKSIRPCSIVSSNRKKKKGKKKGGKKIRYSQSLSFVTVLITGVSRGVGNCN